MTGTARDAAARLRAEHLLRWEAVETVKAQELSAMTDVTVLTGLGSEERFTVTRSQGRA